MMKQINCAIKIGGIIFLSLLFQHCRKDYAFLRGQLVWSYFIDPEGGVGTARPIIDQDRVYLLHDSTLWCFRLDNGSLIWKQAIEHPVGGVSSDAFPHDSEYLYVNDVSWVRAYRKSDGALVWNTELLPYFGGFETDMVMDEAGYLYVGRISEAIRLDSRTGEIVNRYTTDTLKLATEQDWYDQVRADGEFVYTCASGDINAIEGMDWPGKVLCFDAATGVLRWAFTPPLRTITNEYGDTRTLPDRRIFYLDLEGDKIACMTKYEVFLLEAATGEIVWSRLFTDRTFFKAIDLTKDQLFIGATGQFDPEVTALDAQTGDIQWSVPVQGSVSGALAAHERHVTATSNRLWIMDQKTGEVLFSRFSPQRDAGDRDAIFLYKPTMKGGYLVINGSKYVNCYFWPDL